MTEQSKRQYIGYFNLEELLSDHQRDFRITEPIYFANVELPLGTSTNGVESHAVFISVEDIDRNGNIRYCRILIGYKSYIAGQAFDSERHARLNKNSEQAEIIIRGELERRGMTIRKGMSDRPKDLVTSFGQADCLHWDEETKAYVSV